MVKGIIYLMTTAVSGLIKIGQTGTDKYQERMRNLESNGYYNVSGLKKYFAIEVQGYEEKEKLLKEIFKKHQVGTSELFALDCELVQELLLAFDGNVIFPKVENKEKEFNKISEKRRESFDFEKVGIPIGAELSFLKDQNIKAKVIGNNLFNSIEINGEKTSLSASAKKFLGKSYIVQGPTYWIYEGETLDERRRRLES